MFVAGCLFLIGAVSCEQYEVRPENSAFRIEVKAGSDIQQGTDVPVVMTLLEGDSVGDFVLRTSVISIADGASPSYTVRLGGASTIEDGAVLHFAQDGTIRVGLSGLPSGTYKLNVTLQRWYHSASAVTEFTVAN